MCSYLRNVHWWCPIFDLPTYHVLLYNVPYWRLSWTPLPTLISDVINGRFLVYSSVKGVSWSGCSGQAIPILLQLPKSVSSYDLKSTLNWWCQIDSLVRSSAETLTTYTDFYSHFNWTANTYNRAQWNFVRQRCVSQSVTLSIPAIMRTVLQLAQCTQILRNYGNWVQAWKSRL